MVDIILSCLLGVAIGLFSGHMFFSGRVDELEEIVAMLMNKIDDTNNE